MKKKFKDLVAQVIIFTIIFISIGSIFNNINYIVLAKENSIAITEDKEAINCELSPQHIYAGTEVCIKLNNINLEGVVGIKYSSDIPSLGQIKTTDVSKGIVHFIIPKETKSGNYKLNKGYTYKKVLVNPQFHIYEERKVDDLPDISIYVEHNGKDIEPPVITLNGDKVIDVRKGETYIEAGAYAVDNIYKNPKVEITYKKDGKDVNGIDTNKVGTYVVHYNAQDCAGNKAVEVTRNVNVIVKPVITTDLKNKTVRSRLFSFKATATDVIDGDIDCTVTLNGKVILGENGLYMQNLQEGDNKIVVQAINTSGIKEEKTYIITYKKLTQFEIDRAGIILNKNILELEKGKTFQIIAIDLPDSQEEIDMTYSVVKGDAATVDNKGLITAVKQGTAIINVSYPALKNAIPIVVQVRDSSISENAPKVKTNITERKYDTIYFTGDTGEYNFTVSASNSDTIKVMVNDETITESKDKSYIAQLKDGYNIIKVLATNSEGTTEKFYVIKAKKLKINIKNISREGDRILQGDTVRINFEGLETPVAKILRIYNPKKTMVSYDTNIPRIPTISSENSQYDLPTKNALEFKVFEKGVFTLSNGHIYEDWWGDPLYSERDAENEPPNTNASVVHDDFSKLPDIKIVVEENPNPPVLKYTATVENADNILRGSEVVIHIKGLTTPEPGKGIIWNLDTVYETDIPGFPKVKSKNAKDDETNLGTIKFIIPKDLPSGEYHIKNGYVFKETGFDQWFTTEKEFYKGELPDISIQVGDGEQEADTTKPVIITDLEDKTVNKSTFTFTASAKDNVDGDISTTVKLNNQIITENDGKYQVILDKGDNTIFIEAVDAAGNKAEKSCTITYSINSNIIITPSKITQGTKAEVQFNNLKLANTVKKIVYTSNIPGLKKIEAKSDSSINSIIFTIPNDVFAGEYKLTKGESYSAKTEWWKITYEKIEDLQDITITIGQNPNLTDPIIQTSIKNNERIYFMENSKYKFIITSKDAEQNNIIPTVKVNDVKIQGNQVYETNLREGENTIEINAVDNKGRRTVKTYKIDCKRITISVENAEDIYVGNTITINFKGIEIPIKKQSGVANPQEIRTIYNTNIDGLAEVKSEELPMTEDTLNKIVFKLPDKLAPGKYCLTNGHVYEKYYNAYGSLKEENFYEIPNIQINVKEEKDNDKNPIKVTLVSDGTSGTVGKGALHLGQDAKVEINAQNNSDEEKSCMLIVALYDKDTGKMVNYSYIEKTVKAGETENMTSGFSIPNEGNYEVKAMVWDGFDTMNSLSDCIKLEVK